MRELKIERTALQRLALRAQGSDPTQQRFTVGQARLSGLEADILALPDALSSEEPLQILDAGPNFGKRRFLFGISRWDSGDVME